MSESRTYVVLRLNNERAHSSCSGTVSDGRGRPRTSESCVKAFELGRLLTSLAWFMRTDPVLVTHMTKCLSRANPK